METKQIAIAWTHLTYRVKPFIWSNQKTILNELSGSVDFGSVTALMGPSGAGKTTLLNCINGKINEGLDENTKIYLSSNEKIRSCFVGQHEKEHLIMCLTVKENMIFASKLKNSDHKSNDGPIDHKMDVQNIMDELMISDISDTRVDCCSGGQQKRLTIALEMTKIIKPNLLCIDEPTTGLDSNIAEIVMLCLRKLAKNYNIAIITSIHQPNQEIVLMFDSIYVLAKGGNCIFSGHPDQIDTYLSENDVEFIENQIPIEQLLKLASIETKEDYIENMIEKTRESLKQSGINEYQNQMKLSLKGLKTQSKTFKFIDVWYILIRLMTIQYIRQWRGLLYMYIFYILYAISATKMFREDIGKPSACFNPGKLANSSTCLKELEDDTLLYQNQNFFFFMSLMTMFMHFTFATLAYTSEAKTFYYEHQNRWYSTLSYYLAKNIVELFPTVLFSGTYAFLVYYTSGQLLEKERLVGYILLIVLGYLVAETFGHIIGNILQNYPQIAVMAAIGAIASMVTLANYYIPVVELPIILRYMSDWAFTRFMFDGGLILVYGLSRCTSTESSIIMLKFTLKDEDLNEIFRKIIIELIVLKFISLLILYMKTETRISLNLFKTKKLNHLSNESIELKSSKSNIKTYSARKISKTNITIEGEMISNENSRNYICIVWKNLTLNIPKTFFNEEKVILKAINGFFEFGTLNALMGSSGAGKTSLLKCINGLYSDYMTEETTILLSKLYKIRTCFITQNQKDHILIGLTARQSVTYASRLKNPDKNFDHKKNVENIMNELLISNTFDTNVENCSGGEQKRIVIAMELTSALKPNLLCIDEPTSGLDSNAAEVVIKCLKSLSKSHNICVITSIHQPNSDILMMFDKLYVLSKGGYCIYSGSPHQLSQHLNECGILCSKIQLPIEVLIKYSCNDINDKILQQMIEKTDKTERDIIDTRASEETTIYPDGIQNITKRFFLRDFWLLLMRGLTYNLRFYWKISVFQFAIYIIFALFLRVLYNPNIGRPSGCISFDEDFNNTCAKTKEKLEEENLLTKNFRFIFYVCICVVFFTITATILSFALDLKMFINEQRNGWYSTGVYYWSKSIVELIPLLFTVLCFAYLVDIYEPKNSMFSQFVIYLTIGALEVQSIGQVLGILTADDPRTGVFTVVGFYIFSLIFCNIVIPIKELHYSLQIVSNFVSLKLIFESIMILFYGLERCSDREFSFPLHLLDIDDNHLYTNFQLLVFHFFLFRIIALGILLLKVNPIKSVRKTKDEIENNTKLLIKQF